MNIGVAYTHLIKHPYQGTLNVSSFVKTIYPGRGPRTVKDGRFLGHIYDLFCNVRIYCDDAGPDPISVIVKTPQVVALVQIPGNFMPEMDDAGNHVFHYFLFYIDVFGGTATNTKDKRDVVIKYTTNGSFRLTADTFAYGGDKMFETQNGEVVFDQGVLTSQVVTKFHYRNLYYMENVTILGYIRDSIAHFDIPAPTGIIYFMDIFETSEPITIPVFDELTFNTPNRLNTESTNFFIKYNTLHAFVDSKNLNTFDIFGKYNFEGFIIANDDKHFVITYDIDKRSLVVTFDSKGRLYIGGSQVNYIENVGSVSFNNLSVDSDGIHADINIYGANLLMYDSAAEPAKIMTVGISTTRAVYDFYGATIQSGVVSCDRMTVGSGDRPRVNYDGQISMINGQNNLLPLDTFN